MQQVSLVPISAALRLEDAMDEVLGRVLGELNELEGFSFQIRTVEEKVEGPFVVLIMSGGSERKTVDFVADKPDPIVLLAHPSNIGDRHLPPGYGAADLLGANAGQLD
jgi:hypothetical protein